MARADDGGDRDRGIHTGASDARLTELLRADTAAAYPALQELRARHHTPVLAYARLCTPNESMARQLAAQAFTLAARQTARGIDPGLPWRHQLLLLTARSAGTWAMDERAAGLDAGLLLVLNTAGPSGPVPTMLTAFQSLPSRPQGLIWYGVVEREPVDRTAALLGLTREDVTYGTDPALQQLARSCLRARLAASDDPDCSDFGRLIEESVRPDSPRDSADLRAHMARCPHCATAYEELSALRDAPRAALAEGLLPWGGTAYAAKGSGERVAAGIAAKGGWPERRWPRRLQDGRRVVLVSAALGVALLPLVAFLVARGGSPAQDPVGSVGTAVSVPPVAVTVTATVSVTPSASSPSPSPSASPSPSLTSKSPSPTRSSQPPKTARPKPTPSPVHPPNGTYAQVVSVATGLCLDIDGAPYNGTDVVTATCTSARDQRWRVDSERGVLQSYAYPDYCLDSRGSVDRGIGIWECGSVYGYNGRNLRFAVDSSGVIRPEIAPDHAVTPNGDRSLSLVREAGRGDQRWRAGAS
ncbi:RICIN domain-containing protein [Streptomyces viridochromogenes]|uniref:RICIN domain-containing protein n=1 Tax=Streptomyces viridochromogenes TaxID=1938 RepID=UPI00069CEFBB|nr:RICIN domain-containing protein [Streptomyces viridochromogenes]KOG19615.1 ricin-type beta-trefoil lectin domain protein [Streptomyces viridochromogenes]KOG23028.1 ricin-type beta-trefoil lectin domain protein [Streptomyces viridochromogenes]